MKQHFLIYLFLLTITPLTVFAQTGTIEGTVYNQTTGKPLKNVEVHILETDERQKSDADGKVWFTGVAPGTYTLTMAHPEFATLTKTSVQVTAGHTTQARMSLGEVFELETIVVEGERLPPTVSRKDIRGSELLRIAGAGSDALKGLTTLPSIGIPNDFFGVLYIRGSEPGSNLYYLDRTPLGYPFHWGGLLSTISSETIDTIDIYAGAYGAQFGLDSQAVLDIHARDSIDKRLDGKFNINIWYSEGLLEGSIGDKGYVSVSGRRSYLDLIVGPIIENEIGSEQQFPFFSDYQLKFAYSLTEKHHLTVNAFAATDHFHFVTEEAGGDNDISDLEFDQIDMPDTEAEPFTSSIFFKNGFNGQGMHLRSNFNDNLKSHLSLTRSLNFLDIDLNATITQTTSYDADGMEVDRPTESLSYKLKVDVPVYTLREDISYKLTPTLHFEPGFLFAFSPADSTEHSSYPSFEEVEGEDRLDEILRTDPSNLEYDGDGVAFLRTPETSDYEFGHDLQRIEGYLQSRYEPSDVLSFAFGVRLDYLDLIEQVSVQPRGSVSIKLPTESTLRFAYGHYEQSPLLSQLLSENGNPALKSNLNRHYLMEIEHELSSQTEVKFATYYKDSRKLITEDTVDNYLNQGYGYVGGVEGFLRHRVQDKFFGWISYAYTHAERKDKPDDLYAPYLFDNTHIVSVVANYSFSSDFEAGAKWQYLSGTSEAPISTIVLIQDPVTRGLNPLFASFDKALSAKLTPYHRLDFRISKKWNIFGMKVGGFLELLNVYNRKNTFEFILEEGTFEIQGEEIEVEEQEIGESGQIPRLIYFGLTLDF